MIRTSLHAYRSLIPETVQEVYDGILTALSSFNGLTTEEISDWTGIKHERIWKRMSELERKGAIYRFGERKMSSGRNGMIWHLYKQMAQIKLF